MKQYPEISYKINKDLDVYVFDKIDGSNIRADWSSKKGFWRFGSRHHLIDATDLLLGEAPNLIKEKYEEDVSKIFKDLRFTDVTCFFEFYGKSSFAGNHENEHHAVTLFDVNPYKKGMMHPRDFIRTFGHMDIPTVLYFGKVGAEFIQNVRNSSLDGMGFEGVVCKGVIKKQVVMFKIKTLAWINKVKEFHANKYKYLLDTSEIELN